MVFLDVVLPDGNGLQAIEKMRETEFLQRSLSLQAGDPDGAELAIRNGAWDYIRLKAPSLSAISLSLLRALQYREIKSSSRKPVPIILEGIIGNSRKIKSCIEIVAQAITSDANVLITGETGTGKEIFSYAIHCNSAHLEETS